MILVISLFGNTSIRPTDIQRCDFSAKFFQRYSDGSSFITANNIVAVLLWASKNHKDIYGSRRLIIAYKILGFHEKCILSNTDLDSKIVL